MLILILVLIAGCTISGFVLMESIHPSLALEIWKRRNTVYKPKNLSNLSLQLEQRSPSEPPKKENTEGTWVTSGQDVNGSVKSWLKPTMRWNTTDRAKQTSNKPTWRTGDY